MKDSDSKADAITKEGFEEKYADASNLTVAQLHELGLKLSDINATLSEIKKDISRIEGKYVRNI